MKFLFLLFLFLTTGITSEAALPATEPHTSTEPQIYFSPEDRLDLKLIALIEKETKSIHAAIYCFSHKGITKALIDAKNRGVAVEIIIDPFSIRRGKAVHNLVQAKVPLLVWAPKTDNGYGQPPLMHDKFCIFGQEIVWTGSFNFTHIASLANQENAVILKDPAIAKRFEEQFQKMKKQGTIPYRAYAKSRGL